MWFVLLHHIDFGLRVYRSDSDAMIGLESTVQGWLDSMLAVMAEVGRVLRDDGVLWVNLGDSYASAPSGSFDKGNRGQGQEGGEFKANKPFNTATNGIKAGQLLGIPWRFALAMQDAGWILRSDVIWAKKSCMPESLNGTRWERCRVKVASASRNLAEQHPSGNRMMGQIGVSITNQEQAEYTDCPGCPKCADTDGLVLRNGSWRCTSSHEHIFQFVKSMGYYSDGEAVKTLTQVDPRNAGANGTANDTPHSNNPSGHMGTSNGGANRRNVWNDIRPEPYGGEHYATFPSDLPRICIQASTSEAGVCAECGNQWARVVEHQKGESTDCPKMESAHYARGGTSKPVGTVGQSGSGRVDATTRTLSWRPTCQCQAAKVPATVLDCFAGTGTSLLAAQRLGRRSVGTDLSADYLQQAVKRLSGQNMPMEF